MKQLLLALLAATMLLAGKCNFPVDPINPPPTPDAGGQVSTGGAAAATGGDAAMGGASVTIQWPACPRTLKAQPQVTRKLGRLVAPRSMRTVQPWHATTGMPIRSVFWRANIPALDQGSVGACTGFATVGELSTQPFKGKFTAADGLNAYHWATVLDGFRGTWLPDDTGSDGASAQRAAIHLGWSTGYTSVYTLADMHALIQLGPGTFGSNWTEDMFAPMQCHVTPTGLVAGEHQYAYVGFDRELGREWFWNSWGPLYGDNGYFWISSDDTQTLIDDGASAEFANVP